MRYRNYEELISSISALRLKRPFAVVCAEEAHTLQAVLLACRQDLITPLLIGDASAIRTMLESYGVSLSEFEIIDRRDTDTAVKTAIELANSGEVNGIMKGRLETAQLMRPLLRSESKIRVSSVVCAMSLMEVPNYHKLIAGSDPALCIAPTLEEKAEILRNAVTALNNIGIDIPKVAVLAAVETPNPKMPETMDALELKRMNQEGLLPGCVVDGPLSYDLCMDPESAAIKGCDSPVAGDPDLLLYPNLAVGNVLSKALVLSAGAVGSSIILGTKIPVVLPSRSALVEEKTRNILLAAASVL